MSSITGITAASLNYYGHDRDTYRDCLELIHVSNIRHVSYVNIWFFFVNLCYVYFSINTLFGVNKRRIGFYGAYTALALVLEVLLILCADFARKHSFIIVHLDILMLMSYGILASKAQSYMAATMFIVLLVLIGVSYIDTMLRATLSLIFYTGVFIYVANTYKPISIAYQDIYNGVIFLSLSVALHYVFQRVRIQQFVTHRRNVQIQHELEIQSSFDALTYLLNRGRFFSMAGDVLRKEHDKYLALCLLDLDKFKEINDTLGHQMGDKAIQIAGDTIRDALHIDLSESWSFPERALKEGLSFAGRLGGDEFVVLLRDAKDRAQVETLLGEMLAKLNAVEFEGLHGIFASFGVAELTSADTDIDEAYHRADEALYEAKRGGKNRIRFS